MSSPQFCGPVATIDGAVLRIIATERAADYAEAMGQESIRRRGHTSPSHVTARRFPTPEAGAQGVEEALSILKGRWKLLIVFHLFGGRVRRFSELERAIPAVSQKMLAQQLRQLERAGMVRRVVYPQVPPKVEYALTAWGQALCPVLDALLKWSIARPDASMTS